MVSSLLLATVQGWDHGAIAAPEAGALPVELAQAQTVCRRVLPTQTIINAGGVRLRQEPSQKSALAGVGYAPGEQFRTTLESSDEQIGQRSRRIWLKVAAPRAGWIPAGINGVQNIGTCLR
ncbi:MAG: hypothetical protein NW224_15390 [Leptolyngbyaceae cyanobacterium bins.302]|nr:hypothetical protein [Leptolyngbyaceae cyanobacterium bins.302]